MTFKPCYLAPWLKVPDDGCLIEGAGDSLISVVIMIDINNLSFMLLQLIDAFSHLDIPYSGCSIEGWSAEVRAIWVELYCRDLSSVAAEIMKHFSFDIPKTSRSVKWSRGNQTLFWEMAEV